MDQQGLGFGIAYGFARGGLTIVLTAKDLPEGLAALELDLELLGPKAAECLH
jgi:hypothetical protein